MKTLTFEEFEPVFDKWYGTTPREDETEPEMFYRLLTEAEERKGWATEPTPDRKASVLALAGDLARGLVVDKTGHWADDTEVSEYVAAMSLAIHDAVDRAFEGRE